VFSHAGQAAADVHAGDGAKFDEVDDGEAVIGGGDVGVEAQAGAEEGGAVLEEQERQGGEEKNGQEGKDAVVAAGGHLVSGVLRNEGSAVAAKIGLEARTWYSTTGASKRDSSTARRGSFAGANEKIKAASLRSE
jgi:hypothetical protein